MVLGVRQWDLNLFGCHSLKDKRSILQSLKARLRQELNVSVAETGSQDSWQRAEISCAAVGSDRTVVEETLRSADRMVEQAAGARIVDSATSFL
ncbi:MAG: DUF503 domain-containing protein [Gemmatimonadota bacterium]